MCPNKLEEIREILNVHVQGKGCVEWICQTTGINGAKTLSHLRNQCWRRKVPFIHSKWKYVASGSI